MEYDRYNPKSRRPSRRPVGMGAFFDYGRTVTSLSAARSSRAKKSLAAQPQQSPEERWDAEGGNSQTRITRRAQRYER